MTPEVWLKNPQLMKIRLKHMDWTREDLLKLAYVQFKKIDLTKLELAEFMQLFKEGAPKKVPEEIQLLPNKVQPKADVVWKPNKNHSCKNEWYLAEGRATLSFESPKDICEWAFHLLVNDKQRRTWVELVSEWNNATKLDNFDKNLWEPATVSNELQAILNKRSTNLRNMSVALPDNSTIIKRYWALDKGQHVYKGKDRYTVQTIRIPIESPPYVEVEKDGI
jgi:hypothetical protein